MSRQALKKWPARLLAVLLLPGLSGCLTGKLWDGDFSYTNRHSAATNAPPALYQTKDGKDVLVVYVETRDIDFARKFRAFLLYENLASVEAGKRPKFENPARAKRLAPIPLWSGPVTNLPAGDENLHAVLSPDGQHFTLVSGDRALGTYGLPDYMMRDKRTEQLLLTPLTVTADAAIIIVITASIVGLIYVLSRSNVEFSPAPATP
jgi:hypothetical protein